MSIYSRVPIWKPGRNAFILNHSYRGFINIGELMPIARPIECVPGDTFITGNISKVELSPIITDFFGELYFETWQFFVSNDMLYKSSDSGKFTDILASLRNPGNILPLPYTGVSATVVQDKSSLTSYLYGDLGSNAVLVDKHLLSYPIRAVWKIWDEWFRDENLQSEIFSSPPSQAWIKLFVNYSKDRYTSAFNSTQKGTTISLKTVFNSSLGNDLLKPTSVVPTYALTGLTIDGGTNQINGFGTDISTSTINSKNIEFNNLIAKYLNDAFIGFTINDLRLYNKLQKWQERNQICGTRVKEYLLSNYGVTPSDETLQRPVLIGHTKVPVVIDPIISNIKESNLTPSTPETTTEKLQNRQGSRGGIGGASSSFKYGKWFCKEFGWIITLGALRPKASYCQGIHKSLRKDSIINFFNPIFEHLGQQEIKMSEIYFQNTSADDNIFGFQDIYNEMRHLEDFTAPDLATDYENKTMFRKFASEPTLAGILPVMPSEYDYLFAYPHTTAPQATFTSMNIIKAIRPISRRSTPTLT